ncbi:hypothetical protein Ocin01_17381 [Orchesella cincta]|uniref:Uncharacterized protein n=1 Tax=Orchesella cincta TaxID=48709 RepID=A0A1D2M8K0_ORCCI|nr:hypothetical protein Ocin01_17381 [Orchesella cincta]
MKFITLFATALFFAGLQWSQSANISTVTVEQGGSPRLINWEPLTAKNWTDAKVFCKTLGMKLATITTSTQIAFLKNVYNGTTFVEFIGLTLETPLKRDNLLGMKPKLLLLHCPV